MAGKRELIAPKGDKRYIRRDVKGRIQESDDVGRSLAADRRTMPEGKPMISWILLRFWL